MLEHDMDVGICAHSELGRYVGLQLVFQPILRLPK